VTFNHRTIGYLSLFLGTVFVVASGLYIYFSRFHGYGYRIAYADDIGNLKPENKLKVAGVEVGQVSHLAREGNKARISLRMRKDVVLRRDYALRNMDYGLMGDRGLFLDPGFTGDTLPTDSPLVAEFVPGVAEGIRNADSLKVIVFRLRALVVDYSRVDPRNDSLFTTKLKEVLTALDKTSARLEQAVVLKEEVITRNVNRLKGYSGLARREVAEIAPKAGKVIDKTDAFSRDAVALMDKINPQLDSISLLLSQIENGENLGGRIIADKEYYPKLIAAIKKARKAITLIGKEGVSLSVSFF
jgi:hypothetical protein